MKVPAPVLPERVKMKLPKSANEIVKSEREIAETSCK